MYFGISALLAVASVRRLGGLLLILLVAIPARSTIGSTNFTVFELAIPICVFIELLIQKRKKLLPPGLVTAPTIAFYALALTSGYWAIESHLWLNRMVVLSEAMATGWVVYLATLRLGTQVFLRVVAWSATGGAAWALIWFYALGRPLSLNMQPPTGPDAALTQMLRLGSPLLGPSNYYAGFLLLSLPLTLYLCRRSNAYRICLAVQLAAFVSTLSRGGSIALLVAVGGVLLLRSWKSKRMLHGLTVAAGGLASLALTPYASAAVASLLAQRRETTLTGSGYQARQDLWNVALDLWSSHPFLGIGEGSWNAAVSAQYSGQAHNVVLQILAELGVIGLVIALAALCANLVMTFKIRDERLRYCCLAGILGSFLSCLSEATFEGVVFTWFLGAFLGGVLATSAKDRVAV